MDWTEEKRDSSANLNSSVMLLFCMFSAAVEIFVDGCANASRPRRILVSS